MNNLTEALKNNNIVVQNKYYSSGLKEETILKYYQRNKKNILKETKDKPITLVIAYETNQFVIRRNVNNKLIYLNEENFDKLIHGRIISIFVELGSPTNVWCIDIDPGKNIKEEKTKEALEDTILLFEDFYEKGYTQYNSIRVTSTSRGYHVYSKFKQRNTYDKNYNMALEALKPLEKSYTIDKKRSDENEIILDLSVMRRRGSHVVPYALNRNGLMCMDITDKWEKFKRTDAIIRS